MKNSTISKKKQSGFTLIELLISMTIFGFLVYIITAILLAVITNLNQVSQEQYLRSTLQGMIASITSDIQFATSVTPCTAGSTTCITLTYSVEQKDGTLATATEQINYDSTLHTIIKSVTINGNTVVTDLSYYNSAVGGNKDSVDIVGSPAPDFDASSSSNDVLFTIAGQVRNAEGQIIGVPLVLGASVSY